MRISKELHKRSEKKEGKHSPARYDWNEFPERIKSKKQARRHRKK